MTPLVGKTLAFPLYLGSRHIDFERKQPTPPQIKLKSLISFKIFWKYDMKDVSDLKTCLDDCGDPAKSCENLIFFPLPKQNCSTAHCSYLNIYISRKIRLCVVDLEGQFQTTLQAKPINLFIWKFRSIILIFLLFFAGVVKSSAFCTLLMLFQRVEILELQFDAKTWLKWFNLLGIASRVCKKHWIWQLLQK